MIKTFLRFQHKLPRNDYNVKINFINFPNLEKIIGHFPRLFIDQ